MFDLYPENIGPLKDDFGFSYNQYVSLSDLEIIKKIILLETGKYAYGYHTSNIHYHLIHNLPFISELRTRDYLKALKQIKLDNLTLVAVFRLENVEFYIHPRAKLLADMTAIAELYQQTYPKETIDYNKINPLASILIAKVKDLRSNYPLSLVQAKVVAEMILWKEQRF